MRRNLPFLLFLASLSLLIGWLLSKISFVGRIGVNIVHKEYRFLKVWYQGAAVVFAVLMILFLVQYLFQRNFTRGKAILAHIVCLLVALAGLFYTYNDFRAVFTHRILNERFHLGCYLFWIGWMSISIFFLTRRRDSRTTLQV